MLRTTRILRSTSPKSSWLVSDMISEKKSVFQGRVMRVRSEEEARRELSELKKDKKIAKASHNIYAWRISASPLIKEHFDDDREAPGGEQILALMRNAEVVDALVVVTRWYGGTPLGGARFRHIRKCAHDALVESKMIKHS